MEESIYGYSVTYLLVACKCPCRDFSHSTPSEDSGLIEILRYDLIILGTKPSTDLSRLELILGEVLSQPTTIELAVKHLNVILTRHVSPVYIQPSGTLDPVGANGISSVSLPRRTYYQLRLRGRDSRLGWHGSSPRLQILACILHFAPDALSRLAWCFSASPGHSP